MFLYPRHKESIEEEYERRKQLPEEKHHDNHENK